MKNIERCSFFLFFAKNNQIQFMVEHILIWCEHFMNTHTHTHADVVCLWQSNINCTDTARWRRRSSTYPSMPTARSALSTSTSHAQEIIAESTSGNHGRWKNQRKWPSPWSPCLKKMLVKFRYCFFNADFVGFVFVCWVVASVQSISVHNMHQDCLDKRRPNRLWDQNTRTPHKL